MNRTERKTQGFTTVELLVALSLTTLLVLLVSRLGIALYAGGVRLVREVQIEMEANKLHHVLETDLKRSTVYWKQDTLEVQLTGPVGTDTVRYAASDTALFRDGSLLAGDGFLLRDIRPAIVIEKALSDTGFGSVITTSPVSELPSLCEADRVLALDLEFRLEYHGSGRDVSFFKLIPRSMPDIGPYLHDASNMN